MVSPAWKWLLEETLTDEELVKIANDRKIIVKGFSKLSVDKSFHTLVRPRLLKAMSTKLYTVKNYFIDVYKLDDAWKLYRGKTTEELEILIHEGADIKSILLSLLTLPEPEFIATGDDLFNKLEASGLLNDFQKQVQLDKPVHVEKQQELDPKQVGKLAPDKKDKMIGEHKQTISKLKQEAEEQRKQFAQERQELQQELSESKKQVVQFAPEKVKAEQDKKQADWSKEKAKLERKIEDQDKLLKLQKTEIEKLDQQVRELQAQLESHQNLAVETAAGDSELNETSESEPAIPDVKVALIGKHNKINSELARTNLFDIELIDVDRIDQVLELKQLSEKVQVWLVGYETPMNKKRKLKKEVEEGRLKIFETLHELKTYLHN